MHVEPKHIVTGAVMTVLLALFLFWQGDADGMDQQVVQIEQGAPDASQSEQAAKRQMAGLRATRRYAAWRARCPSRNCAIRSRPRMRSAVKL